MAKRAPKYADVKRGYGNLWAAAQLRKQGSARTVARRILRHRRRYEQVADAIGAPRIWPLIGAIHDREASGSFRGVLHNGEHIIGTGRRTRLVPKGRGPFASWEEAAVDALRIKGWHRIEAWPIARWLFEAERFNGWGYFLYRHVNSPYVWAGTSLQERGKYIADGRWSRTAWDEQLGVAAVLIALFELESGLSPH